MKRGIQTTRSNGWYTNPKVSQLNSPVERNKLHNSVGITFGTYGIIATNIKIFEKGQNINENCMFFNMQVMQAS